MLRGLGIGASMMPAMAAAYATLESSAVPRATSALNVMQRDRRLAGHGAARGRPAGRDQRPPRRRRRRRGTLERLPDAVRARVAEPLADAFAATFWWAVGISLLALIPATVLAVTQ